MRRGHAVLVAAALVMPGAAPARADTVHALTLHMTRTASVTLTFAHPVGMAFPASAFSAFAYRGTYGGVYVQNTRDRTVAWGFYRAKAIDALGNPGEQPFGSHGRAPLAPSGTYRITVFGDGPVDVTMAVTGLDRDRAYTVRATPGRVALAILPLPRDATGIGRAARPFTVLPNVGTLLYATAGAVIGWSNTAACHRPPTAGIDCDLADVAVGNASGHADEQAPGDLAPGAYTGRLAAASTDLSRTYQGAVLQWWV